MLLPPRVGDVWGKWGFCQNTSRHHGLSWGPVEVFIHGMNGPVSAPWLAFQELGHTQGLLCAFFTACALCIWELFVRAKILQDPVFSRLCTSWRVEIPGRRRKKNRIKKVLDCFSSANCSLRQVIVVKSIHKYSDSSLIKYQAWDLFKCQQPPSLPAYCRVLFITKCFLFHRKSKSNLGGQRAQKSNIKMFLACPMNQLTTLCSPQWKELQ